MIRSLPADPGSHAQQSFSSVLAERSRPGSHTTLRQLEDDKAWLRTVYVGIEKPCRSMQTRTGTCMNVPADQSTRTRLQSQTRSDEVHPGQVRLFVDLSLPESPGRDCTVQVQYIPAFRGGSCASMYCCTVSDGSVRSRLHATSGGRPVCVGETQETELSVRRLEN
jgi:hypothetical protein